MRAEALLTAESSVPRLVPANRPSTGLCGTQTKHLGGSWEDFLYMRKGFYMLTYSVNMIKGWAEYSNYLRELSILFIFVYVLILLLKQNILT